MLRSLFALKPIGLRGADRIALYCFSRGAINETEYGRGFELAIVDIQLFGAAEQVRLAKQLASDIADRKNDASAGPLLLSLRNALRMELDLGVTKEEPIHFRLQQSGQPSARADSHRT